MRRLSRFWANDVIWTIEETALLNHLALELGLELGAAMVDLLRVKSSLPPRGLEPYLFRFLSSTMTTTCDCHLPLGFSESEPALVDQLNGLIKEHGGLVPLRSKDFTGTEESEYWMLAFPTTDVATLFVEAVEASGIGTLALSVWGAGPGAGADGLGRWPWETEQGEGAASDAA